MYDFCSSNVPAPSRRSTTTTERPDAARLAATARPAGPPPATSTSIGAAWSLRAAWLAETPSRRVESTRPSRSQISAMEVERGGRGWREDGRWGRLGGVGERGSGVGRAGRRGGGRTKWRPRDPAGIRLLSLSLLPTLSLPLSLPASLSLLLSPSFPRAISLSSLDLRRSEARRERENTAGGGVGEGEREMK
eukprot:scaffold23787_cov29-Tisochrysis_lutea.AAC.3